MKIKRKKSTGQKIIKLKFKYGNICNKNLIKMK